MEGRTFHGKKNIPWKKEHSMEEEHTKDKTSLAGFFDRIFLPEYRFPEDARDKTSIMEGKDVVMANSI